MCAWLRVLHQQFTGNWDDTGFGPGRDSMQASTNVFDVLYVTADAGETQALLDRFSFDGVDLSVTELAPGADQLDVQGVDCLVLCDSLGPERTLACLRTVRSASPTLPILAFSGDADPSFAEALLDAGATDVVQSSGKTVPPELLERRLETVLTASEDHSSHERILARLQELSERDELFRQVAENISDVVWVNNVDETGLEFINDAYEDVWGRQPEPLYQDRSAFLETIHPDDRDRVSAAMDQQLEDPESYDEQFRVVRPDGAIRWVHSRAFGVREDGVLRRIVGVATDITERKIREEELAAERDLVERILETSPVGIVVIDTDGTITRANEQAASILGVSQSSLEGGHYAPEGVEVRTMDGTTLPAEEFPFQRIRESGAPLWDRQLVVETPDGEQSVIAVDGVPLFDDDALEQVVITFDDVTDRVERERRLTNQRDELAQLNHINRIIRGVDEALLGATSREEILQAVCDNIATADRYQFAVALRTVGGERLEPVAWADQAAPLVEEVFPLTCESPGNSPGFRAIETGETQVIQDLTPDSTSGESQSDWRDALVSSGVRSLAAIPVQYDQHTYGVIAVYAGETAVFSDRELDVLGELGGTVGYAIAAIESREREQMLTSLYEATQDLLAAETETAVCDVVVDTASAVLELSGIGIFLFDGGENVLEPVAATETLLGFYDEWQRFGPGREDSITWQTYVTGERQFFSDVRESDMLANEATSARSALLIPLGDHGVFVVGSTETDAFDEQKRQLVGLLAATTEAALDRVAGQAGIRERDQQLEERQQRLDRFERMLTFLRQLEQLLRQAATREEIEQGICDLLVQRTCVSFAWVGRVPPDGTAVEPQAWAGDERGYLDAVSLSLDSAEPAPKTAATGEVTNVSNVADHLRESDWARQGVGRDFESVLSVPLTYGDTAYGVLTAYATETGTFDNVVFEMADELGETLGYGINSAETRRGILTDRLTELELRLGDTERVLNAVADISGESVRYREITPESNDRARVLFAVEDTPIEDVLTLESEFVAVDSLTHVDQGDEQLFRATLSGQTVATTLLDCGGIPRAVVAEPTDTRVTVWLPQELDVRVFLERVRERYPDTEMVSRRPVDRSSDGPETARLALSDLTDRQREVLVTAYESGFFQSPRETTGEELADLLDLAQPTVTHHLREAQRRLLSRVLEAE